MRCGLSRDIQFTLKDCYDNYSYDKHRLTVVLHAKYRHAFSLDSNSCGDELIPFSEHCLKDNPVSKNSLGAYKLNYRFPEATDTNKYPEFTGCIVEDAVLNEGDIIDRIGSEFGSYASPVPKEREVYSATERAIPYWLLADKLEEEPSYHRYIVKKTISRSALILAIETAALSEQEKRFMKEEIEGSTFVYGDVAQVDAFGKQGYGGGKQYSFCVKIHYLLELGFLKEV